MGDEIYAVEEKLNVGDLAYVSSTTNMLRKVKEFKQGQCFCIRCASKEITVTLPSIGKIELGNPYTELYKKLLPLLDVDIDKAFRIEKHKWLLDIQRLVEETKERI